MRDMPKRASKYYKMWISMFPETWSESDLERFYMFIHILLAFQKKDRPRSWLEENLREDCSKLNDEDIEKYCDLYIHLKSFKNVWKSQQAKLLASGEVEERMKIARKKYSGSDG